MPASSSAGRRLSLSRSGQSIRSCSLLTASGLASTKAVEGVERPPGVGGADRLQRVGDVARGRAERRHDRRDHTAEHGRCRRPVDEHAVDDLDADDEAVVLPPLGAANGAVLVAALADRAPLEVGDAQRFAGGLELVMQHAVGRRGVAEVDDDDVEAQLRERRVLVHADVACPRRRGARRCAGRRGTPAVSSRRAVRRCRRRRARRSPSPGRRGDTDRAARTARSRRWARWRGCGPARPGPSRGRRWHGHRRSRGRHGDATNSRRRATAVKRADRGGEGSTQSQSLRRKITYRPPDSRITSTAASHAPHRWAKPG